MCQFHRMDLGGDFGYLAAWRVVGVGSLAAGEGKGGGQFCHHSMWDTKSFGHKQSCPFQQVPISTAGTVELCKQEFFFLFFSGLFPGMSQASSRA